MPPCKEIDSAQISYRESARKKDETVPTEEFKDKYISEKAVNQSESNTVILGSSRQSHYLLSESEESDPLFGFEVVSEQKFAKEVELESNTVSITSMDNTDWDFTGFK